MIAGAIVVGAGALGYLAYRVQQPMSPVTASEPADLAAASSDADEGQPAGMPSTPPAKPIPDTLPDITLADEDGKPTPLSSFGGRPLMVNFWATWCAPCRREIPLLNKIHAERMAQGVEIVGIAVDFRDKVLDFTQETRIDYPLLIGEEDGLAAAEAFGMGMAFPFSVFVDSQNRILTVKIGELHEDEANFAFDRLRDVDRGVLTREAAQQQVAEAFRRMAAERAQKEAGTPADHAD
ncbi:MAG TPA: TlpA disulfide reductase family protein [Steroidobacteraceae bacterium]